MRDMPGTQRPTGLRGGCTMRNTRSGCDPFALRSLARGKQYAPMLTRSRSTALQVAIEPGHVRPRSDPDGLRAGGQQRAGSRTGMGAWAILRRRGGQRCRESRRRECGRWRRPRAVPARGPWAWQQQHCGCGSQTKKEARDRGQLARQRVQQRHKFASARGQPGPAESRRKTAGQFSG